jgi:hypothetical protein
MGYREDPEWQRQQAIYLNTPATDLSIKTAAILRMYEIEKACAKAGHSTEAIRRRMGRKM